MPQRDALAHAPVQIAKVVFHLAEIGQQLARQRSELLKALLDRRVAQHRHMARFDLRDFRVDGGAARLQLGQANARVGLTAFAHFLEQAEHRQQARLGADKAPLGERRQPGDGFFGGRCQVELRLVRAGRVELAQPALVRRGPVVEVLQRGLGESLRAQPLAQAEQFIVQRLGQIGLRHHAQIGRNEHTLQKTCHQRHMVRA